MFNGLQVGKGLGTQGLHTMRTEEHTDQHVASDEGDTKTLAPYTYQVGDDESRGHSNPIVQEQGTWRTHLKGKMGESDQVSLPSWVSPSESEAR